jgi:2-polyprenyl-6-methoxyphenol hydroxylase-like FAD-dependent oxidoreductase
MRTLIIGAGVAGLTLAALLRRRGESPVVVERNASAEGRGYMLGLYPIGGRVLHGLGLHERYADASVPMTRYRIGNGDGEVVRDYDLGAITERYGPIRGIHRGALIDVLREGCDGVEIRTGTTVDAIDDRGNEVIVRTSDGAEAPYDLVVGADGLHSRTRSQILPEDDYAYWDTGWGGWVFWADPADHDADAYDEYWGAARFLGLYPVHDRLGLFVGGPVETLEQVGRQRFVEEMCARHGDRVPALRSATPEGDDAFYWTFHDCRCERWRSGRVVLLGDAAVGFLPTAGVGASMAMESAAALADELSRTGPERVEQALDLYEKRHRKRVERAQQSSRQLGRMMVLESPWLTWGRNQILHFYSVERLVKDVADIMDEPI